MTGTKGGIRQWAQNILGLAGVTAVVVIAAGVSISARYGAATSGVAEESVFAGLSGQFEDIGEIEVRDKDKTLTIKRAGALASVRSAPISSLKPYGTFWLAYRTFA